MATTKKTTTKTTNATTSNDVKTLRREVAALREEVQALKTQTATPTKANTDTGAYELEQKVLKVLRLMGTREWLLREAGLK